MMLFVTLSSMFVGNMVLLIVYAVSGQMSLMMMPLLGAFVTGCAITRQLLVPERRPNMYED